MRVQCARTWLGAIMRARWLYACTGGCALLSRYSFSRRCSSRYVHRSAQSTCASPDVSICERTRHKYELYYWTHRTMCTTCASLNL